LGERCLVRSVGPLRRSCPLLFQRPLPLTRRSDSAAQLSDILPQLQLLNLCYCCGRIGERNLMREPQPHKAAVHRPSRSP
jgi:hypothetical protein